MQLVILDETIKECKGRCKSEGFSGEVVGRILDTVLEGHIYIAALPVSASGCVGGYQRIGRWEICEIPASAVPLNGEGVELFLSPDSNDLLAFYGGHEVEDVHIISYRTDFAARMQGIVDCELLAGKRVFIIGGGSVGSKMAMHLARAGVGKFALIDFDIVEVANLCRCEYFVNDIGRYKTLALRDRLLSVNPGVEVETYQRNVMHMEDDELLELIRRSDLLVSAADDPAAEQRLNALAHSLVPVVYPALYSRAAGGEVIFTLPDGPCYQCVVGAVRSVAGAPRRGEWDYTTPGDLKAEPGLGIDVDHVVTIAGKIALALLMQEVGGSGVAKIIDKKRTLVFVSNQRQWMYSIPFETFGIAWAETGINRDCVVCRVRKGSDDELLSEVRTRVAKATTVDLPRSLSQKEGRKEGRYERK